MKNIKYIVLLFLLLLFSCKKSTEGILENKKTAILKFSLGGVTNTQLDKKASLNSLDGLQNTRSLEMHDGFESSFSFGNARVINPRKGKYANLPQGTSYLNEGVKYRLLVYEVNDQNEEVFYSQLDLESKLNDADGEPLEVFEGSKYRWYAYSYNSTETLAPIVNLLDPVVPMGDNADFISTQGEIEITDDFVSQDIIFERRTAQLILEVDARGLFTDEIRDLTIKFPANKLKTGSFKLKNNEVIDVAPLPEQTISLSDFENVDEGYTDRKQTFLYTVESELWNDISFSMSKLDILLDDNTSIRSFPSTNLNIAREFDIEVGYRYRAKVDLIESALDFGGVSWGRENLYRTNGTRNPYRFYHENKQTNDFRSYFSFKGHVPGKWASGNVQNQLDPCALVYPANRWMQPTKASFHNLTRTSTNLTSDGVLPNLSNTLAPILSTEATLNATYGANYIQYNTATGTNPIYPASSNVLRFYYNGYDIIDLNILNDGWVNLDLGSSYGVAVGLWTSEQGVNILGLVGAGAWGYFGTTWSVISFGNNYVAKGMNSIQLLNVNALGLNIVSSARKNVRCIRNPAWEALSQLPNYNSEPNLN